jgi:chromosomal replication initiation ATPase DnaA
MTRNTRRADMLTGWPRARKIIASIAAKHGIEPQQLQKNGEHGGRFHLIVQARAEAMTAIRRELGYSFPLIGRVFGGFHHTSVMHLVAKLAAAVPVERPTAQAQLDVLESKAEELLRGLAELRGMMGGGG